MNQQGIKRRVSQLQIKKDAEKLRVELDLIHTKLCDLHEDSELHLEVNPDNHTTNRLVDQLLMATESVQEAIDELEEIKDFNP